MSPSAHVLETRPLIWPYRLAMSVIVAGALTFGAGLSYVLWPTQAIYVDTPIMVDPHEVKAGGWVRLNIRYSKPYHFASLVGAMIVSKGNVVLTPASLSALPPGEHQVGFYVQIPAAIPPDTYVIHAIIEHRARLPFPAVFDKPVVAASVPFEVLP
jgi:hypothetical protein